ncbi:hypothetical protein [Xanthomonas theicola]|uniref:hypothetical protein n=1 Tax=Xanthomonas theicola TaxID=56464 RepID=UPI000FF879AC|nr:hypothetical protein [Xanthomonas theicola]
MAEGKFAFLGQPARSAAVAGMGNATASGRWTLVFQQGRLNADLVYDLFHVVAKYGRKVIDRVRVDEANRLREEMTPTSS